MRVPICIPPLLLLRWSLKPTILDLPYPERKTASHRLSVHITGRLCLEKKRTKQWSRLAEFEDLRRVRQIAAAVFRDEHHVFDAHGAETGIVEAGLYRHDMAFLEQ